MPSDALNLTSQLRVAVVERAGQHLLFFGLGHELPSG
jgi:hypothetical protein